MYNRCNKNILQKFPFSQHASDIVLSFLFLKDWEKHFLDAGASKPSDWNSELDGDWLQKPPYEVCGFFLQ
jgi:hypothetical protein